MERELRDLYNRDGTLSGKTYFKGDNIDKGYYPMVVAIVIENRRGEFLMQKRSPQKGGYWSVTGGHPKFGETPEQGIITEVEEELGIDISNDKLTLFDEGCDGQDCFKFYYLNKDIDISNCELQESEVSDVAWFAPEELKRQIEDNILEQNQISVYNRYFDFLKNAKLI